MSSGTHRCARYMYLCIRVHTYHYPLVIIDIKTENKKSQTGL